MKMAVTESIASSPAPVRNQADGGLSKSTKGRALRALASVALGALIIPWPAFYNRLPLFYPDSIDYVRAGHFIARTLFLHRPMSYYGLRSSIYSLGILPFVVRGSAWPAVAFQCLLTSFVLWLVFRSIVPHRTASCFLVLIAALSLGSSLSWYGSLMMPDILAPNLFLCVYLLVFARDTLSRAERCLVYFVSWFAIASHGSHLLIVVALALVLAMLAILTRRSLREYRRVAVELAVLIALSLGAQIAVETLANGRLSLNSGRPPFLTVRLVADGPGRWYLEKHCANAEWETCRYLNNLGGNSDHLLWDSNGIWTPASGESRKRILGQERAFAFAVVCAYPLEELEIATTNFWRQLMVFGVTDLRKYSTVVDHIGEALPRERSEYLESPQGQDRLPSKLFSRIQRGLVIASLLGILAILPKIWRLGSSRLLGLGFVIFSASILNALVTGTLSSVNDRYQSRVIWLVPMLAGLCAVEWMAIRTASVKEEHA